MEQINEIFRNFVGEIRELKQDVRELKQLLAKGRQRRYELKAIECTKQVDNGNGQVATAKGESLFLKVNRQFIFLDTVKVKNSETVDAALDVQGDFIGHNKLNNMMTYVQDHPAQYYANFCEMRDFYSAAGVYMIPDIRVDKTAMSTEKQYCWILQLIDY